MQAGRLLPLQLGEFKRQTADKMAKKFSLMNVADLVTFAKGTAFWRGLTRREVVTFLE